MTPRGKIHFAMIMTLTVLAGIAYYLYEGVGK